MTPSLVILCMAILTLLVLYVMSVQECGKLEHENDKLRDRLLEATVIIGVCLQICEYKRPWYKFWYPSR